MIEFNQEARIGLRAGCATWFDCCNFARSRAVRTRCRSPGV